MHGSEPQLGNSSHHAMASDILVGRNESGFLPGSLRSNNDSVHTQHSSEAFLQSLREFIYEQHGVSIEGWRAAVRTSPVNNESYPIYYSPDGKMFESMSDVACFLGPMSEKNPGTMTSRRKFHSKKRKFSKNYLDNECCTIVKNRAVLKDASKDQGISPHSALFRDNISYDPNQCQIGDPDWQQFNVSCIFL